MITTDDIDKTIKEATKPTVIEVGMENCQKCQMMKSIISIIEEERDVLKDRVDFVMFDAKEKEDSIAKFGITNLPFFLFVENGNVKESYTGLLSIKLFENKVLEVFGIKEEEEWI